MPSPIPSAMISDTDLPLACGGDEEGEEMSPLAQSAEKDIMDEEGDLLSAQELEMVKEECRTNKHVKPPYSYIALITMAVLQVTLYNELLCSALLVAFCYFTNMI